MTADEKSRDVACLPYVKDGKLEYARDEAKKLCEDNTITADNECSLAQPILALQPWVKGGCAKADVIFTGVTWKDVCRYFPYFTCPVDSVRVACNFAGTRDSDCWQGGQPAKVDTHKDAVRATCRDPRTVPKTISYIDGACCQGKVGTPNIRCADECSKDEVWLGCASAGLPSCAPPKKCCGQLRLVFQNQTRLVQ